MENFLHTPGTLYPRKRSDDIDCLVGQRENLKVMIVKTVRHLDLPQPSKPVIGEDNSLFRKTIRKIIVLFSLVLILGGRISSLTPIILSSLLWFVNKIFIFANQYI